MTHGSTWIAWLDRTAARGEPRRPLAVEGPTAASRDTTLAALAAPGTHQLRPGPDPPSPPVRPFSRAADPPRRHIHSLRSGDSPAAFRPGGDACSAPCANRSPVVQLECDACLFAGECQQQQNSVSNANTPFSNANTPSRDKNEVPRLTQTRPCLTRPSLCYCTWSCFRRAVRVHLPRCRPAHAAHSDGPARHAVRCGATHRENGSQADPQKRRDTSQAQSKVIR